MLAHKVGVDYTHLEVQGGAIAERLNKRHHQRRSEMQVGQAQNRGSITPQQLISAEKHFGGDGTDAHGDVGGDRMPQERHNYAPIYAKHLEPLLEREPAPTVAEVGILTGSGLAMWSELFPKSRIFGFDVNTSTYLHNREYLQKLGFDSSRVKVMGMDQRNDNQELLQKTFGVNLRPSLVVDDGYHVAEAGAQTFLSFYDSLADKFVYFIEDVTKHAIQEGEWKVAEQRILNKCASCTFVMECPPTSDKDECMAVIARE